MMTIGIVTDLNEWQEKKALSLIALILVDILTDARFKQ